MGNVINFRSDAPGIIQYHFAFYEIIPIYVLIMISKKSHINQIKHESNDNVILYILFNMFVSFLSRVATNFMDNPRMDDIHSMCMMNKILATEQFYFL